MEHGSGDPPATTPALQLPLLPPHKLFPFFVFKFFIFSSCQGLCSQDCPGSSESPVPLKTAQTLTQPLVPSLSPPEAAGSCCHSLVLMEGLKQRVNNLASDAWSKCWSQFQQVLCTGICSTKQKPDLYLSLSQRHARNE